MNDHIHQPLPKWGWNGESVVSNAPEGFSQNTKLHPGAQSLAVSVHIGILEPEDNGVTTPNGCFLSVRVRESDYTYWGQSRVASGRTRDGED